jgi:creatinine amidohydrolase/Fe(II)-dependent formamide hydrolase-like protein
MSRGPYLRHAADFEARFGMKVMGVTREVQERWKSLKDHAARNETEGVMAVRPDLVDLERLGDDRSITPQGIRGEDPRESTMEQARADHAASVAVLKEMVEKAGV